VFAFAMIFLDAWLLRQRRLESLKKRVRIVVFGYIMEQFVREVRKRSMLYLGD
jgi:hypothetical protein